MTITFRSGQGLSFHELNRLGAVTAGTYAFPDTAGGAVTASSGLTVAVAAITGNLVTINGTVQSTNYAGGTVTAGAASSTLTRIDTVYYDGTATVAIAAGTAVLASSTLFPVPPTLTAGQIAVANLWIGIGATTIAAGDIDDRRASGSVAPVFYDSLRTAFRANRYSVAHYYGNYNGSQPIAMTGYAGSTAPDTGTSISGEPVSHFTSTAASSNAGAWSDTSSLLSPNHSPRLLCRVQHPAASANVTYYIAGFFIGASATPTAMAGLRIVTTGNVFGVTRVAAAETTTDLGVLSRVVVLGYEVESVDAGVTWVIRNQAGTALMTSTTNVPVAATGMQHGVRATIATAAVDWAVATIDVQATFA